MSRKFRVLYRQFLFRLMDVELLSQSAHGDANELLGQLGALLIAISVLVAWFGITAGAGMGRRAVAAPIWGVERFMVSLTMMVVGIFAVLNWDSTFLDRRDVLVLAPLPVRGRTLFAAKAAAAASALGLTIAALNSLSAFAWPIMLTPSSAGIAGMARFVAAFWLTLAAAGAFLYCAVLSVQAVAAQLPRRWYLRVSSLIQLAAFGLFLGMLLLQPSISTAAALAAPENQRALDWLPTYWFMGLLSEWSGAYAAESHAVMAPLARRALVNLAIAILVASGAFLLSYLRTMRKVLEEPDIVPGARGGVWLPRFGNAPQTALAQFFIRTLMRSRRHCVILAFYLGGGFAIVAVYLAGARQAMHLTGADIVHRVNIPMLVSTVLMLCAAWLGTRTVFSLPLDLRANWLFRVTPTPGGRLCLTAVRRALLWLTLLPVWVVAALVLLSFWPWLPAAQHLLLLALLGSILVDSSLTTFRKIPFTCSYLPGKSKVHMIFWLGIIPLVIAIHKAAELEQRTLANPAGYAALAVLLGAAAFTVRRYANTSANQAGPEIQFEETAPDELIALGLN